MLNPEGETMRLTRFVPICASIILAAVQLQAASANGNKLETGNTTTTLVNTARISLNAIDVYNAWNLGNWGLSKPAFESAFNGFNRLSDKHAITNDRVLTIVDYSKPSSQKRLYVVDMVTGQVVFNTLVAHGRNSGMEYATDFSNENSSYKTSLGFYVTLNTYFGGNGYSLRLKGCEYGINNNAFERAIVMHGADYVSNDFIRNNGHLGRSFGCPAVPVADNKKIIDRIKDGSCLFLYHPSRRYFDRSTILNS